MSFFFDLQLGLETGFVAFGPEIGVDGVVDHGSLFAFVEIGTDDFHFFARNDHLGRAFIGQVGNGAVSRTATFDDLG